MSKTLIFLIPIVVLILMIGFFWYNSVLTVRVPKDYQAPADTVSYISYTRAADMNGSYLNMSLRRISDDKALISCSYRKAANKARHDYSRRISADIFNQIMEVIDEHGMAEWLDLPQKEIFLLDGASQTLRYRINRTNYVISSISQMPDEGEGFHKAVTILTDTASSLFKL
ncbi:MAG: hypothetical protein IJM15_08380 [Erysipelotrichaceae bacterium]|nr:hypothetical protein [Erysipelotrichaceae bacterium]